MGWHLRELPSPKSPNMHGRLPADFERVNWVNMVLVQLWPYIAVYITEQSKPVVNQSLEANKPAWMETIKLLKCVWPTVKGGCCIHWSKHDCFLHPSVDGGE